MSQHDREDAYLADQGKAAFHANRQVDGSPRLHAELRAQGIRCGQKRVARLMRAQELAAQRPRHPTITTQSDPEATVAPNLLQRDFSAEQPNQRDERTSQRKTGRKDRLACPFGVINRVSRYSERLLCRKSAPGRNA
ncbi:MAG TPA: IS3 family transposase [Ktedonobacteraceae bacterium]|nr:IS3 family transposase [Ktedonobacteraceae bacterium]